MSDIYNTFPYYGYGTEDGSSYYKKPQSMDEEAVENAIDEKISDLVGNAPSDLDTIEELAAAVQSGSGDASDIYAKIDEIESKIPTTVEQLSDSANYAKVSEIPNSLEGLDNSETKYQSEDEVSATVEEAVENLFASVEYDDNTKKIIFKNSDGAQVGEVDATDFIKDGMVSGATIENGKLIITFNEESGSENVEVDLTDIFNPSNYYTATDCDNKYQPKGDYTTLAEVESEGYTKFDGDYESLTNKPVIPTVPENVSEFTNDANYTTLEEVAGEGYSKFDGDYENLTNKPVIPVVPENVSEFTNDAGYLDKNTADGYYQPIGNYLNENALNDYYTAAYINEVFVDEQDMEHALEGYATESDIASTVHDLVVRLNKLEAQNEVLVEKGTDSAEDIAGMENTDTEDVVLATDSAIEALATPMTFKSVTIVGGEVGNDTVINTIANDTVDINGLTVSGGYPKDAQGKRTENGKIKFATNEITINNLNIEPGCTAYNVFEGLQDMTSAHSIDKFTAKNVVVNDTDLEHNVFNIYQLNNNAEVLIENCSFNLNVANSNVLRMSNITNAENVTVTFKNIDLTYENKPYTDADIEWAGLVIYQAYGNDLAFAGDTSKISTWTFNFINCRYNSEVLTENEFGTIKQLMYQYKVNNQGCEKPEVFNINVSAE